MGNILPSVLLIGDSMPGGLDRPLCELFNDHWIYTVYRDGTRIDHWTKPGQELCVMGFDLIVISLGTNDAFENLNATLVADNAQKLRESLGLFLGNDILWLLPPAGPKLPNVGVQDAIKNRLESQNLARVFDTRTLNLTFGPDGIHPDAEGFEVWAKAVADVIRGMGPHE